MKFKDKDQNCFEPNEYSCGEVVKSIVRRAPDYYDGQLESATAKVNKLAEIVAAIADLLPDSKQQALLDEISCGWVKA